MPNFRYRPTLFIMLSAWLGMLAFALSMLISTEVARWERQFDEDIRLLTIDVKRKLDTNEAVLAGFSAFLKAIDRSDAESASRYAAVVTASYPHIYMMEVARKLPLSEQTVFEATLRAHWRSDFRLKSFSELTERPAVKMADREVTWPILFMYPSLPNVEAIYGLRLETVDYLMHTLALAHESNRALVSPVFWLYEGDPAYILLQDVVRSATPDRNEPNFFGNTMTALLVIKTRTLLADPNTQSDLRTIHVAGSMRSADHAESQLFTHAAAPSGWLDRNFLPAFQRTLPIENHSQPVVMSFERQLRWSDVLNREMLLLILMLAIALFAVSWLIIQHYLTLKRSAEEHERSAYLATHDLLTNLPNRFLFIDRFEQAVQNWKRNGNTFALLLIDLDHFKAINDQHGHEVGDQVLIETAKRMTRELRSCDTVARQGGDEFIVLLANMLNGEDAEMVSEKLRTAIFEPIETTVGPIRVSCCIGIANCPAHGIELEILRRHADHAMYQAKDRGRNACAVFSAETQ